MEGGANFSLISFVKCFNGCRDQAQIRVGSILKKVHTLKPGSSKRLNSKKIYKAYMPGKYKGGVKSLLYYYDDESCHPYI
ncbi:unnamed protein product [Withania somnifera]